MLANLFLALSGVVAVAQPVVTKEAKPFISYQEHIVSTAYSPKGTYVAVLTTGGVQVLQSASKSCVLEVRFPGSYNPQSDGSARADASVCTDFLIVRPEKQGDTFIPERILFSPQENALLLAGAGLMVVPLTPTEKPTVLVWSKEIKEEHITSHQPNVASETFSADGTVVVWHDTKNSLKQYNRVQKSTTSFPLGLSYGASSMQWIDQTNQLFVWNALGWGLYNMPSGERVHAKEYDFDKDERIYDVFGINSKYFWVLKKRFGCAESQPGCSWLEKRDTMQAAVLQKVNLSGEPRELIENGQNLWAAALTRSHLVIQSLTPVSALKKHVFPMEEKPDSPRFLQFSQDARTLWHAYLGRGAKDGLRLFQTSLTSAEQKEVRVTTNSPMGLVVKKLALSPGERQAVLVLQNNYLAWVDL